MARDEVLEEDERVLRRSARCLDAVHLEEARQHHRHLHDAEPRLGLAFAREHDAEVQALVADVRERMARVDRDRREDREDFVVETLVERRERIGRERVGAHEQERAVGPERGQEAAHEPRHLLADQLVNARRDLDELFVRGEAVRRKLTDFSRELLLEARDADHEELVEVRGDDCVELQPLEERHRLVLGLGEDPRVELDP